MKNWLRLLLGFMLGLTVAVEARSFPVGAPVKNYTVYIFLAETCPISQFYTLTLKDLHRQFASETMQFQGIFPNTESTPQTISEFNQKYQLPFFLYPDPKQELTKSLKATVTPEVIIKEEKTGEIVYQGRIDDSFIRVGKRRPVPREHDLRQALIKLSTDQPVSLPKTEAVGCYITFLP